MPKSRQSAGSRRRQAAGRAGRAQPRPSEEVVAGMVACSPPRKAETLPGHSRQVRQALAQVRCSKRQYRWWYIW